MTGHGHILIMISIAKGTIKKSLLSGLMADVKQDNNVLQTISVFIKCKT
jgi:hypothetical protein